jgi:hypothetical protein
MRKAHVLADIERNAATASGLIGGATINTGESINLTLRIAAARIQSTAREKQDKLTKATDLTA